MKERTFHKEDTFDVAIIGAGPGGLAAALRAYEMGIKKIALVERESFLGGILPQCIHAGFGLKLFDKELTGPEYNQIFMDRIKKTNVQIFLDQMALKITARKDSKAVTIAGKKRGFYKMHAKALILALGCRERTRGALCMPGMRPAGIYTAGLVQKMINQYGMLPVKEVIVLGSGDIGLIMARRLALEGCKVLGVYEIMPFSSGLSRNISQCLSDYDIPLHYSHTVTNIYGNSRIEAVDIAKVDQRLRPIKESASKIRCDALLLSVGLIPENELSKTCAIALDRFTGGPSVDSSLQTSLEGIYACGNSLYVNDIADDVTEEGYQAAESAAAYLRGQQKDQADLSVRPGIDVTYAVPQRICTAKEAVIKVRVKYPIRDAVLSVRDSSFKKNIKIVLPGEMITLRISKECVAGFRQKKSIIIDVFSKKRPDQKPGQCPLPEGTA